MSAGGEEALVILGEAKDPYPYWGWEVYCLRSGSGAWEANMWSRLVWRGSPVLNGWDARRTPAGAPRPGRLALDGQGGGS